MVRSPQWSGLHQIRTFGLVANGSSVRDWWLSWALTQHAAVHILPRHSLLLAMRSRYWMPSTVKARRRASVELSGRFSVHFVKVYGGVGEYRLCRVAIMCHIQLSTDAEDSAFRCASVLLSSQS